MADILDQLLSHWAAAAPDLDTRPLGNTHRILRLARILEKRLDLALAPLGLSLWQFEVLSTLLTDANGTGLLVHQLLPACQLSPAAMTNRLDRLEQAGWIQRVPDPGDRRAIRIRLTAAGRDLVQRALHSLPHANCVLTPEESSSLDTILRKILSSVCTEINSFDIE